MKTKSGLLWSLIFICTFFSCAKEKVATDQTKETASGTQKPDVAYNVNAGIILDLANEVRAKGCTCGATVMPAVPVLVWNDLLAKAAYNHSNDMQMNNYFSHTSGENTTAGDRIKAVGYNWRAYGENIAMGQTTEQIVLNSWLNSEGHCKNIMNKNFKEMGIGRSGNYWTQVFAAK
ncbi:CAP domain-containing protein [Agriterribacter sp.]|uniref:CAP domain-containing protein n=1 Tax=Agriterribacter sp. TaxID=2821509 RepID=UPI002CCAEF13|nr:CAP domain-containing protein [Agriterribacter sp.]HTN05787.1 CAP domain-containing protein [Agriterribacter sp.]